MCSEDDRVLWNHIINADEERSVKPDRDRVIVTYLRQRRASYLVHGRQW